MQKFSEEVKGFIKEHVTGLSNSELTDLVNKTFGLNFKVSQISGFKKNNKLRSGLDCRFKKGQVSINKGKRGIHVPGTEKTWFRKGSTPHNHKPIGSERVENRQGYTLVKVAEPNVWRAKHKIIYEAEHGPLSKGQLVIFLDGDRTNLSLDNLKAISKAESLMLTRRNLRFDDAELTRTATIIAKIKVESYKRKRGLSQEAENE